MDRVHVAIYSVLRASGALCRPVFHDGRTKRMVYLQC